MRASIRILQLLVILITSLFVWVFWTLHNYWIVFGVIAFCAFLLCLLQVAGIDQTLQNPVAKKYFQIGVVFALPIVPITVYSATLAMMEGEYKSAAKLLAPFLTFIGLVAKNPEYLKILLPPFMKKTPQPAHKSNEFS